MCGRLADAAVSEGFVVGTVGWRLTEQYDEAMLKELGCLQHDASLCKRVGQMERLFEDVGNAFFHLFKEVGPTLGFGFLLGLMLTCV